MAIKVNDDKKKDDKRRTSVKLPDKVIELIDEIALERYDTRAYFLRAAMRNFLDRIIEIAHDVMLENTEIDANHDFQYVRYYTRINEELDGMLEKYSWAMERGATTGIGIALSVKEDEDITLFCNYCKKIRNVQRFARYAALYELDRIQTVDGYLNELYDFLEAKKFDIDSFKEELKRIGTIQKKK